ncbi:hypothetical protein [Bacillus sp. PK3_68]|uniref:DUF3885 domain-containing protein n=1 Tax=Bacillus sp. PK3_68 TaxID=2027408 RepID=UPI000E75992A|nr:hypothetical protein [Bacillus sp. PK3_68]RJS50177.1 hypothetical protein CJ483_23265 [Bacillus sp. PK3_68]
MDLQPYLSEEFNDLDLIRDSFMEHKFSVHLQLEKNLSPFKDDSDELNELYFKSVYKNAISIFEDLFQNGDSVFLVLHIRSDLPLTRKTGIYEKYVKNPNIYKLACKKVFLEDEQEQIIQYSLLCQREQLSYKQLIKAICNQDFRSLKPRLKDKNTYYPEIFFININKNIILNIYDDRGGFILLNNPEDHKYLENKYKELLMEDNY